MTHSIDSIDITNVPTDIFKYISLFNSIPKVIKKRLDISTEHREILNTAHKVTEQLYVLSSFSQTCQSLYKSLTESRTIALSCVSEEVNGIYTQKESWKIFEECVGYGCYLQALRVYYFQNPRALYNDVGNPFSSTILHRAVVPIDWDISVSFVSFVIEMDKKHKLLLAQHQNTSGETPLQRASKSFNANFSAATISQKERASWNEIKPLLESYPPLLSTHPANQ